LRTLLAAAEGPYHVWSNLFFAGAIILTAVGGATAGVQGALAYNRGAFADDNLLKTLNALNYYSFSLAFALIEALLLLSGSLVILRTAVLWTWLGWLGLVMVVVSALGALAILSTDPTGPLGILGLVGGLGL